MVSSRIVLRGAGLALIVHLILGCGTPPPTTLEVAPPTVTVSQPVVREVIDYDHYEGRIGAVETVEVRARVRGHLVKVSFQDGAMVKEGDLLFEIDPRPYKASLDSAQAQKAAAEAALQLAKSEYDRTLALARSKAASREELEVWTGKQAVAAAERQKAVAEVERAQLDLDFTKIAAPIAGKTSRTQVTKGNLVNALGGETLLTTLVSVDPVYVYFDVDERALLRYRHEVRKDKATGDVEPPLRDLKIPIKVALEGDESHPHKGVIDFADNRVNASTGTIQARGVLPNTNRILDAGMRARVMVPVSDKHKVLMVTERAIGNDQGRKFVYVVNAQDVVERRDITPDRLVDGMQTIKEGLRRDDRVIVNGIQRVREGTKVQPHIVPMTGATSSGEAASQTSEK